MNRLVILGAGGFIGQSLVKALSRFPENEILAFDRFSNYQTGSEHPFTKLTNVKIVAGNFFNRDEVSDALKGADYVFHLVSSTNPAASNKDPFIDIDTNVRSSIELFELCVEHGVKKIIFPSSGGTIYGNTDTSLIDETVIPAPQSPYGIGKLTIEHYLRYFKFTFGLDYIVYRIANPYGPGQNIYGKQGVIPIFMHKFLTKKPVTIFGDGSMVRDYLYIDDLVDMISRTYSSKNQNNEYNIGSGKGFSVNEILQYIEKCAGYRVEKEFTEIPLTFVHRSVLDIRRFTKEFGEQSFTTLEEGIERTWGYVKQL